MPTATRTKPTPPTAGSIRPFWIPANIDFENLPQPLQAAIQAIIEPAYEQLVVRASPGLEQSTGCTIVSLMALEIFDVLEVNEGLYDGQRSPQVSEERDKAIARLLRVMGSKVKASNFLLRLQEFRQRWGHLPGMLFEPIPPGGMWADDLVDDTNLGSSPPEES